MDLLSVQWHADTRTLSLMACDEDHGGTLYASNECVVVCPESMKFTLPPGTPFGNEGDPLWILPQTPYPDAPCPGISAEHVPGGLLIDPLTIRLTKVDGPGHFLLWQADSQGRFDVRMDTRDGIGGNDFLTIPVGGHAHYNWGFTTSGLYRVYFQAEGRLLGQTTNLVSPETPFTFHILPLRPFEMWTATNWPCECATNIVAAGADPDGDRAVNAVEYLFGTDPKSLTAGLWPQPGFVTTNGRAYGALTFTRSKTATDAFCEVMATSDLAVPGWRALTNLHSLADEGFAERLTIRDDTPLESAPKRFYQLRLWLR